MTRSLMRIAVMVPFFMGNVLAGGLFLGGEAHANDLKAFFKTQKLTHHDAVLVTSSDADQPLYSWQAEKPLVPASLVKLATSWLAIQKWGVNKRFTTHFYRSGETLWLKGYGDPFLVSEELDLVKDRFRDQGIELGWVNAVAIDNSYFKDQAVPGRSTVADPYNAPLSAVAVNFNTVQLANQQGDYVSTEPQTPLTKTAVLVAKRQGRPARGKRERINLINLDYAASNAAELIIHKLGLVRAKVSHEKAIPDSAELIYRHSNSRSLADVVQGMLEYSNNFIANQTFLMLPETAQVSFNDAASSATRRLKELLPNSNFKIVEGAGLSRGNRFTAEQIDQLLTELSEHKSLLKEYEVDGALVHAKTGTLNGVRSFAGYIETADRSYQFVFNFNRKVPYRYRETLLNRLVEQLKDL